MLTCTSLVRSVTKFRALRVAALIFFVSLLALAALSRFTGKSHAANFVSTQSGQWTNAATWGGQGVPGAGDSVIINSGHTVTVTGLLNAASLVVAGNGTLTFTGASTLTLTSSFVGHGGSTVSGPGAIWTDGNVSMTVQGDFGAVFSAGLRVNSGTTTCNAWGNGVGFSPTEFTGPITIASGATLLSNWTEASGNVTNEGTLAGPGVNRFDFKGPIFSNSGTVSVTDFFFSRNGIQNVNGAGTWNGNTVHINSNSNLEPTSTVTFGPSIFGVSTFATSGTLALNGQTVIIHRPGSSVDFLVDGGTGIGKVTGAGTLRTDGTVNLTVKGDFSAVFSSALLVNSGTTTGKAWGNNVGFSPTELSGPITVAANAKLISEWIEASDNVTINGTLGEIPCCNRFDFKGGSLANNGALAVYDFRFLGGAQNVSGAGAWTTNTVYVAPGSTTALANSVIFNTAGELLIDGTLDLGASSDLAAGPIQVRSGGTLRSIGTGDLTLSGNVTNNGTIQLNGGGQVACETTKLLIRSSVNGTQRSWVGGGTFQVTDADVKDQAGSAAINVLGGVNSGNNGANWTFSGNCPPPPTHTISGRVTNGNGAGLVNVTMALTGSQTRTTFTDANGNYQFDSLTAGGNYTVSPSLANNNFSPANRTFNNLNSNQTGADFSGSSTLITISGRVIDTGSMGVVGVTVNLTGAATRQTATDSSGRYAFRDLAPGSYTVATSNPNFTYTPTSTNLTNVSTNQNADFLATSQLPAATNGRIAYIKSTFTPTPVGNVTGYRVHRDLWVMNADGSGQTTITPNVYPNGRLSWSPDGSKIALCTGAHGLGVMNSDGSNFTQLAPFESQFHEPAWSPDGLKIAFTRIVPVAGSFDVTNEIWLMNADGTNQTRLAMSRSVAPWGVVVGHPTWSPDGNKIAFLANRGPRVDGRDPQYEIYVMNADGTAQTNITNSPDFYEWSPAWSPDGSKIVFTNAYSQIAMATYTINPDGTNRTQLLSEGVYAGWSPDGTKIVFTQFEPSARGVTPYSIRRIDTGGGNPTVMVSAGDAPAWTRQSAIATPTGVNINVLHGNATVTYSNVNTAGATTINPIAPTAVLPLPSGYATIAGVGMAYNITTTANVTPPITACFKVPNINDEAVFNSLRILHGEGGTLVDRTILAPDSPAPNFGTRTVCSRSNSLSPFVIAQKIDSSLPTIDGLVVDSNGNPLSDVTVELTGSRTLTTTTDINGRFLFANLPAGGNYTVAPVGGGFNFAPLTRSFQNLQLDQAETFVGTAAPPPPPGFVTMAVADLSVNESQSSVSIPVLNLGVNTSEVRVNFATGNGTSQSPADYQASSGTLVFAPGEAIKTITIPIVDDLYVEGNETFQITLTNPSGAGLATPNVTTVTIVDDDSAMSSPPQLRLDSSGPDASQAAALESLLFVRDPFKVLSIAEWWDRGPDRNTRVTVFVTGLSLNPGESAAAIFVNLTNGGQSFDLTAEDARPVPNSDLTQVTFRLPDNLAAGTCTVKITVHGFTSNGGTFRISP